MATRPRRRPAPPPPSLFRRGLASVKRNPVKSITAAVILLGGLPSAVAGANYLDPIIPAFHYWVLQQLEPLLKVQNTQAVGLDRFLLYQQQNALANAKADSASKTSPIVQERVKELESQSRDTQARICKATGKGCP